MKTFLATIVFLAAVFSAAESQGHYVPAYVWIPTLNLNSTANNSSAWNKTTGYGHNHTVAGNNTNYRPPAGHNSTVYNGTQDGHLFVGTIQPFDRQLFSQEYFKPRRWWSSRDKIIEYPKDLPAGYNRHETISAIRIFNRFYDGNTARASILAGGIHSQYVKIKLESSWGKGFSYLVQIYGH